MVYSGAIIDQAMSSSRRMATFTEPAPGEGMFGWTDTHEHAKIVARQLHIISHIERWPLRLDTGIFWV